MYRAGDAGTWHVFSVPLDGSSAPVQLSPSLGTNRSVGQFLISPHGTRVAYLADQTADEQYELFLVPIDGSAPARLLTPLGAGGQIQNGFRFSPDGSYLVGEGNTSAASPVTLFSVRTSDGTTAALQVEDVASFQISADSTRVAFLPMFNRSELSSAPIDGGSATVRINPAFVPNGRVLEYAVTPDSQQVVYRADAETTGVEELYRVPIVPSGPPVATKLNPALAAGGDILEFALSPDSCALRIPRRFKNDSFEVFQPTCGDSDPIDLSVRFHRGGRRVLASSCATVGP